MPGDAFGNGLAAQQYIAPVKVPVLVANGTHDVMEPSIQSFEMARKLREAETVFDSGAGHAFLFQFPEKFARLILDFYARSRELRQGFIPAAFKERRAVGCEYQSSRRHVGRSW